MKKTLVMNNKIALIIIGFMLVTSGCTRIAALATILSTPGRHERKVTAEYNISEQKNKKVLVLVQQSSWIDCDYNLQYYLTKRINDILTKKAGLSAGNIIDYDSLFEVRSDATNFSMWSLADTGNKLGANFILLVTIEQYLIESMPLTEFINGSMSANAAVFTVEGEERLWPASEQSRLIKVGFEAGKDNKQLSFCI